MANARYGLGTADGPSRTGTKAIARYQTSSSHNERICMTSPFEPAEQDVLAAVRVVRHWRRTVQRLSDSLRARADQRLAGQPLKGDAYLDFEADLHFYCVALKNLLASLAFAKQATRDRVIGLALRGLDTRVPHIKLVRDVQEHFDEYLRGKGNQQLIVDSLDTPGRPQRTIVGPEGGPAAEVRVVVGATESIEVLSYTRIVVPIADHVLNELQRVANENLTNWLQARPCP